MTAAYVVVAAAAWRDALRHSGPSVKHGAISFPEAGTYLSVQLSANLLMQLERLLAANLLSLRDLATLGVVLAVVGPPFRLLQLTVGYALQPRLRAAESHSVRIRLLMNEGIQATATVLVAGVTLWFATPLVVRVVLHGKFTVATDVLLAALVSGALKVYGGIAKASMTAIADNRELAYIGLISWIGVAVAIACAAAGAHLGLSGVIYGVAAGWAVRVAATAYFVSRRLQRERA
jgi:O-antigen/teichoic acid export membrane protein